MLYISFLSVSLFVPDWSEENKVEAAANLGKDIYYNDDDEVRKRFGPYTVKHCLFTHVCLFVQSYSWPNGGVNEAAYTLGCEYSILLLGLDLISP